MYSVFDCSTVLHYPLVLVPRYGSPAVLVLYDHDYDRYNRDYDYANSSDLRSDHGYDHRDRQWLATVTMTTGIPVPVLVTTATTTGTARTVVVATNATAGMPHIVVLVVPTTATTGILVPVAVPTTVPIPRIARLLIPAHLWLPLQY